MNILLAMMVIFVLAWVLAQISKMNKKELDLMRKMDFPHKVAVAIAFGNARDRLQDWHGAHPNGPWDENERTELENLIFEYVGSHMILCAVHDVPFNSELMEMALDHIEDWR